MDRVVISLSAGSRKLTDDVGGVPGDDDSRGDESAGDDGVVELAEVGVEVKEDEVGSCGASMAAEVDENAAEVGVVEVAVECGVGAGSEYLSVAKKSCTSLLLASFLLSSRRRR